MEQSSGTENDFEKEQAKNAQVISVHLLVGMPPFFPNQKVSPPTALTPLHLCSYINENKPVAAGWRWGNMMITTPTPQEECTHCCRNNRCRPVGVQHGGDVKAVETSDSTGLLT